MMIETKQDFELADWTSQVKESEIRRLLRLSPKYYFAGGKPGNMPMKIISNIISEITLEINTEVEKHGDVSDNYLFNYGATEGTTHLREMILSRIQQREKIPIPSEGKQDPILITTGSQQSIYAAFRTILNPGDVILVPRPTYLGIIGPLEIIGATIISVPMDQDGLLPDVIENACLLSQKVLNKTPKALYVATYSDNPGGITHTEKRKKQIFELAEQYNMIIIEDLAYKEIQFDREPVRPIKSLDVNNERVIYTATTSKEAAVLRLSYSVVPEQLFKPFVTLKGYLDLCTSPYIQEIGYRYYANHIDRALDKVMPIYETQAAAMKDAVDSYLPGHRTDPTGGFFIWQTIPDRNLTAFLETAIENGIIYVPGSAFYSSTGFMATDDTNQLYPATVRTDEMRLSFSSMLPEDISEGIKKLGQVLETS